MTPTETVSATAAVATGSAVRYMKQLCRHFAHKVEAEFGEEHGLVRFAWGTCELDASRPGVLLLNATSTDAAGLERLIDVVGGHLERFAFRENLQIIWQSEVDFDVQPEISEADRTLTVDTSGWPVLVARFTGAVTLADLAGYLDEVDHALEQEEPFGVAAVVYPAYFEAQRDNTNVNFLLKWLNNARPALIARCRGMAYVTEADDARAIYGPIAEEQGGRLFGFPVRSFATLEEAEAWLREQLAG